LISKETGSGFRTTFKAHDEGSRVKQQHAFYPIMSKQEKPKNQSSSFYGASSLKSSEREKIKISLKKLEKNFRKEQIKGRSSWQVLKPGMTSQDPYIANPNSTAFRDRRHHKELESRSPQ